MCYNAYLFSLNIPAALSGFINTDLGPDPRYTWITISWNLGGAILVTIAGRLSDLFGRRYFFLTGSCVVFIGSIIGATAQSIDQMIASGAIFGVGSGFLEMSYGSVQEIVPNEWRLFTVGALEASGLIAHTTPLIAWAMIKYTGTWRYAYWYMCAFHGLTIIVVFFFYHPPTFKTKHKMDHKSKIQIIKDLDYIGLVLFVSGCVLFLVGINWGGCLYPWLSATTIVPIVLGVCLLIALGVYEAKAHITYPLLPPKMFKRIRLFTMPLVVIAVSGMQYYSNAVLWPRMSQLLWATDEISKGLYAECIPLGSVLGGLILMMSKRFGHQRWQVFGAVLLQTACVGAMAASSLDNPAMSIVLLITISITTAPAQMVSVVMIGFGIEDQADIGVATSLAGTTRLLFGAAATAIFSNILTNTYTNNLPDTLNSAVPSFPPSSFPQLLAATKLNTAAAFMIVPGITPAIQAAAQLANKQAYLSSFKLVFLVAVAFGAIASMAAVFTKSIDERKFTTKTVAVMETDRAHIDKRRLEEKGEGEGGIKEVM